MELRKFISEALVDIIGGVVDAQAAIPSGKIVAPSASSLAVIQTGLTGIQSVEFEVAVTTEEHSGKAAKLNVVAAVIGGGVSGESGLGSSYASKLRFKVPIELPDHPAKGSV